MSAPPENVEVHPESRKAGYEVTDAHIKPLAWLAVGLAIMTLATMVVCYFFIGMVDDELLEKRAPEVHPMSQYADRPSSPVLQTMTTRETDIEAYRAVQKQARESYAWSRGEGKHVAIPLEQAIDKMFQEGAFPHRPDTQQ